MLLSGLVETSRAVGETAGRNRKIDRIADLLRRLAPDEIAIAVAFLSGTPRQGRIGLGVTAVSAVLRSTEPAAAPSLGLSEVDAAFGRIARVDGPGASTERRRVLAEVLRAASGPEREFLARLVLGELRQGALEGIALEAIVRASGAPAEAVRRAAMVSGDLASVAAAALTGGAAALDRFPLVLFRPLQPMLAQPAGGVDDALRALGEAALEHKLDGVRVQVHRDADEVRVFTRALRDVTPTVPEIVRAVRALPAQRLVLDGEALAFDGDGAPRPFQETMRRLGRRLEVDRVRAALPVSALFFDALHLDGQDLLARPARERFDALARTLPPERVVPRLVTGDPARAAGFLEGALRAGHEGIMVKALDAPYVAGQRGGAWLKVKPAQTLDLVVLAAEWGHGRRAAWLSNLHLGARDPVNGGFVMLGKTFKGMTDAMLAWQTQRLRALALGAEDHVVHVRPELVVEVAFEGLQESPRYPAGLALRFARVRRYREDKHATEADTIDTVRALHAGGRSAAAAGPPSTAPA